MTKSLEKYLSNVSSQYGAPMGRRNTIPNDTGIGVRFRLQALRWVDGDYDNGGAYWGHSDGTRIWFARAELDTPRYDNFGNTIEIVEVFVRARDRKEAKWHIKKMLPNATFCK